MGSDEGNGRELGSTYLEVRGRIRDLIADLADPGSIPVPACPGWSIHALLSHLAGNCADLMRGNIDGVATDGWTAAQVDERSDRPTAAVLEEWDELAPQYASIIDDFPGAYGRMALGDIVVHEHDLRGALARPGERDSTVVSHTTDFLVTYIMHPGLRVHGLGPLELRTEDRVWTAGGRAPATRDPDSWRTSVLSGSDVSVAPGSAAATLTAPRYELFRALTGRRSAAQIRALDWSLDPEPYLPAFGSGPFTVRDTDLDE